MRVAKLDIRDAIERARNGPARRSRSQSTPCPSPRPTP